MNPETPAAAIALAFGYVVLVFAGTWIVGHAIVAVTDSYTLRAFLLIPWWLTLTLGGYCTASILLHKGNRP